MILIFFFFYSWQSINHISIIVFNSMVGLSSIHAEIWGFTRGGIYIHFELSKLFF